jgi:squalene-hopene/tetraprenyl-beta-curcumene cyclase
VLLAGTVVFTAHEYSPEPRIFDFDAKTAAAYLDARAEAWSTWPNAQRDGGTFCISCHTTLPYALARPALREALGERQPSAAESKILNNLVNRARKWREVEPFYPDQTRGLPKTSESRATEAVMNAVVLSRRDAGNGHLSDEMIRELRRVSIGFDAIRSVLRESGPRHPSTRNATRNLNPASS